MILSIVTINYNNLAGLRNTTDSIIHQTWRDFEWIIIDGGSNDGAKEYIESLVIKPEANVTYWCSESDSGVYNAMNKGLMMAKGEYVCFMNSGDCFYENAILEEIFTKRQRDDVLYGDACFVLDNKKTIKTYPDTVSFRWLFNDTLNHQATFCKTEKLKKFMFDESYKIMADRKVWLQLYMAGCTFKHLPIAVALYDHSGMSATDGERWISEFQRLHGEIIPRSIQNNRILSKLYKGLVDIKARVVRLI